ncbi:hypothetical protein [Acholeplasma hippikon]|uniref:Uncharacterized protein n=1 Tax=Acholeplasma hippikon TaxID=264636 RepID=A0A449BI57_9MOLU|nr:hypothetical protein [Acholeplasma hippikon]VEU82136.1 Uncharacterised protein [Acholeplasma hippikon]
MTKNHKIVFYGCIFIFFVFGVLFINNQMSYVNLKEENYQFVKDNLLSLTESDQRIEIRSASIYKDNEHTFLVIEYDLVSERKKTSSFLIVHKETNTSIKSGEEKEFLDLMVQFEKTKDNYNQKITYDLFDMNEIKKGNG